ncbi:MipA/OmpV family protein [Pseudoalteromonas fenneropenaei]|uniref:MipA/OmpV family protein n=1 Tax=Pseudoalteromonas fenneropenaei TaxID=1737459 RepID=A0ABV7CHB3_9GAMM
MKFAFYLSSLLAFGASFQTNAEPSKSSLQWGIGVALLAENEGYKGVGVDTQIVPAVMLKYGNFSLLGPRLNYQFGQWGDLVFSAQGKFRFDGYEAEDDEVFAAMAEREMSFDVGLEVEYDSNWGDFSLAYSKDISTTHRGYDFGVSYALPFQVKQGLVAPFVSANYMSSELVDYYYGVKLDEANLWRHAYQADSSWGWEFGIRSDWMFASHHMIKADVSYRVFGAEIKDSPLVDSSGGVNLIIGYIYVF